MIEKLVALRSIGRFRDFKLARGSSALGRVVLVYAENSLGKSTLAGVFRSLATGVPDAILERETFGHPGAEASILIDGEMRHFSGGRWSGPPPERIVIFDSAFVDRHVSTGFLVEREHKRQLFSFAVGAESVACLERVREITEAITKCGSELTTATASLRTIASPLTPSAFVALDKSSASGAQQNLKELSLALRVASEADVVRSAAGYTRLDLEPVEWNRFETFLASSYADLDTGAERAVRRHFSQLGERSEDWVARGVDYMREHECPFCRQDTSGSDIVSLYRSYFSAEYSKLKAQVSSAERRVEQLLGDAVAGRIRTVLAGNVTAHQFWAQYSSRAVAPPELPDLDTTWADARAAMNAALQRKRESPLDVVLLTENEKNAFSLFDQSCNAVQGYNAWVVEANRIADALRSTPDATARDDLTKQQDALRAHERRWEPATETQCNQFKNLVEQKEQLESEKSHLKKRLDELTQGNFKMYGAAMNTALERMGCEFRISVQENPSYLGKQPSCEYRIRIAGTEVDPSASPGPGQPSFRTVLSDGDRNALALAFFLARLALDNEAGVQCTVVFDDPVSSLDSSRRHAILEMLGELAQRNGQLIVLSHDPVFLRDVRIHRLVASLSTSTLCIARESGAAVLRAWDVASATRSQYERDYAALDAFAREEPNACHLAAFRAIRPVLEGAYKSRYAGELSATDNLTRIIECIRDASDSSLLAESRAELRSLQEFDTFAAPSHHTEPGRLDPSPEQVRSYACRTLRFIAARGN